VRCGRCKPRIAGTEAVIRDIAINVLLFEKRQLVLVVVAAIGQDLPHLQGALLICLKCFFDLLNE